MNDLYVLTADSDAQAVMRQVLERHQALQIRKITFYIDRHPLRDNGVVTQGPELMRLKVNKEEYSRLLLLWDHDGSGLHGSSEDAAKGIECRLQHLSWKDRSKAIVIVPELEEWLWHNPPSIAKRFGIPLTDMDRFLEKSGLLREPPKELLERVLYDRQRRKPLPRDFQEIARTASLKAWQRSTSFSALVSILRDWFPLPEPPLRAGHI